MPGCGRDPWRVGAALIRRGHSVSEVRGQRSEDRGQRSEDRGQKSETKEYKSSQNYLLGNTIDHNSRMGNGVWTSDQGGG